jgi:hypothetical protein
VWPIQLNFFFLFLNLYLLAATPCLYVICYRRNHTVQNTIHKPFTFVTYISFRTATSTSFIDFKNIIYNMYYIYDTVILHFLNFSHLTET